MKQLDRFGSAFLRMIVRQMKALGLNQSDLARRMNVSRAYVSKVLQGDVNISFSAAAHFCHALKLDFVPTAVPKQNSVKLPSMGSDPMEAPKVVRRLVGRIRCRMV